MRCAVRKQVYVEALTYEDGLGGVNQGTDAGRLTRLFLELSGFQIFCAQSAPKGKQDLKAHLYLYPCKIASITSVV